MTDQGQLAGREDHLAATGGRDVQTVRFPAGTPPGEAELIEIGRAAFGYDLDLEVASATTYYDSSRVARTFRQGRVLLAGDAAHVRTPGGNLGEGFGDVANLGWKLAAVLAGHAPDALLGSGRFEIAGVELDERYDASAVIWYEPGQLDSEPPWRPDHYEDDPRPGHRAPDGYVDPWGDTLYDRIGNDLALLVLTGDPATGQAFAAEAAARSLPFTVIHLLDPAVRELYGADNVLIRPDQHVAWRGARVPGGGAAAVLDRILGGRFRTEYEHETFRENLGVA